MSTFGSAQFPCGRCGAEVRGEVGIVVNLGKRADMRQSLLQRRFNTLDCPACGFSTVVTRTVGLVDFSRFQWILCYPLWAEVHWQDLALAMESQVRRILGAVPPADQGRPWSEWKLRVVFGYEAAREKLRIWDEGLDDAAVEQEKLAVLAGSPERIGARIYLREAGPPRCWGLEWGDGTILELEAPPLSPPPLFDPAELHLDPFVCYRRWLVPPRRADPLTFDLDGHLNPRSSRDRIPT